MVITECLELDTGFKVIDNYGGYLEYQLSVKKEDRAKGTWTLQQYEGKYRSAMYAAVKETDPNWQPGQPFNPGILDRVTRERVESTLVKSGNTFVKKSSGSGAFNIQA